MTIACVHPVANAFRHAILAVEAFGTRIARRSRKALKADARAVVFAEAVSRASLIRRALHIARISNIAIRALGAILSCERLVALALCINSTVAIASTVFERVARQLAALTKTAKVTHIAVLPNKAWFALAGSITEAAAISAAIGSGIANGLHAASLAVLSSGTHGAIRARISVKTLTRCIIHAAAIV